MKTLLLKNADAVLLNEISDNSNILIENGIIKEISQKNFAADEVVDLENNKLFSGFIDIHNHGAIGFDVNESSTNDLIQIAKFLVNQGITAWLPTLVPDSVERYQKATDAINKLIEIQKDLPIAQCLGVHYEGVFANKKMCGALRPQFFKSFEKGDEISQLPKLSKGIHFITLAPEVENGIELIKELTRQKWIVSIGHTKSNSETLENAFNKGAKHLTHFFNAMTALHHRDLGVVGWALDKKDVTFDIIADGIHVHPKMLKFAVENKTVDKVSLISDSIAPAGLGDGEYKVWNEKISVIDGKTENEKGSIAGSVITMLDAVKMMLSLGFSEIEVSKMASLNPAKLLGIDKNYGSIEVGKRADLIVFDKNKNVKMTLINGIISE
ncbi:MAG: N-acetylglucosamine-6-phosphate deacetylase [Aridibacter sp.]